MFQNNVLCLGIKEYFFKLNKVNISTAENISVQISFLKYSKTNWIFHSNISVNSVCQRLLFKSLTNCRNLKLVWFGQRIQEQQKNDDVLLTLTKSHEPNAKLTMRYKVIIFIISSDIKVYEEPVPGTKKIPHYALNFEWNRIVYESLYWRYCNNCLSTGSSKMQSILKLNTQTSVDLFSKISHPTKIRNVWVFSSSHYLK